jgi:hypothetical protein
MCRLIVSLCVCGWIFTSCSTGETKTGDDSITGVYVREYSTEILNQLSGEKVGMRTFRDTITISEAEDGYRVDNSKWRMNDYDQDGWRNMKHGETKPLPTFEAKYDQASNTLNSENPQTIPALRIKDRRLFVGETGKTAYVKID